MQSVDFYQSHLDRVSRSFAFCIRKLEDPLRRHVSLSYLLCRVLDTVEDSIWEDKSLQSAQYSAFEHFLQVYPNPKVVTDWARNFPDTIPETEKQLLADSIHLFQDLHSLPEREYLTIRETVLRMSYGMRHYAGTELKLSNLKDVNQYCYFVAGIVGELLTKLFLAYRPDFVATPDLMKDAFHFGLFLQKVNLLKDQLGDEKEGRFLVPNRELVLDSLRENARGSLRYITAIPTDEAGYRTFCGWSLFLGLGSMPFIQQNYAEGGGVKISREMTAALLEEIEKIVCDNDAIWSHGEECMEVIPPASTATLNAELPSRSNDDSWFHKISGGVLHLNELTELGIITP